MRNRKPVLGVFTATIILGLVAGAAGAATLHVANNGTDSATCGAVATPCRSVSQAIANAAPRSVILVGPGRYGDLNGNGILGEPGEEPGPIVVDKQLTLQSEEGAGATIIDMSGLTNEVVHVSAAGAGSVIGKPGKGFTLSAGGFGLVTEPPFSGQLTISGNIAINNIENGFLLHPQATYVVTDNLAIRNGATGFLVHGGTDHKFKNNAAIGNGIDGFGADGGGTGHDFTGNVAIANGVGGFRVANAFGLTFRDNSAVGNTSYGIDITLGSTATLTQNNIFGNDPAGNCGLVVGGGGASVMATNNFFGAATGPGPDPADNVCVDPASTLVYIPFATKEFPISTTWK